MPKNFHYLTFKIGGSGSSIQSSTDEQKVTLVFFLGGCTFAEISALRFLSQQEAGNVIKLLIFLLILDVISK